MLCIFASIIILYVVAVFKFFIFNSSDDSISSQVASVHAFPDIKSLDPYDESKIKKALRYWDRGLAVHKGQPLPAQADEKYLLFDNDCGGFNNIRMGFEVFVMMAYLMNRTLVFPPPTGWYLLDWGPRQRMKSQDESGLSDYNDYFDLLSLQMGVTTISTAEFLSREGANMNVPEKYIKMHEEKQTGPAWRLRHDYEKYIQQKSVDEGFGLPWSAGRKIVLWPSIDAVKKSATRATGGKPVEYTDELKARRVVSFPSCVETKTGQWRYLGQVARYVFFDDPEKDKDLKRMLRDHVHFIPHIFDVAGHVIAKLGLFKYAAYHIRRNELQYKDSFQSAEGSYRNTKALLITGENPEKIYIASDETSAGFFDAFTKEGHEIFFWKDFFGPEAKPSLKIDEEVPRKLVGCIEQVICAGARIFFGTRRSTFTAYITRLRGYIDAPDKNAYLHNNVHTGDPEKDGKLVGDRRGTNFFLDNPEMWEVDD